MLRRRAPVMGRFPAASFGVECTTLDTKCPDVLLSLPVIFMTDPSAPVSRTVMPVFFVSAMPLSP